MYLLNWYLVPVEGGTRESLLKRSEFGDDAIELRNGPSGENKDK